MLEDGLSSKFWPPLVKEVTITRDYPGYKYEFFTNFDDLNNYFTELCGEDWRHQEWAKYWIGQHRSTKYQNSLEIRILTGDVDPAKLKPFVDYPVVAENIIKIQQRLGKKVSALKILKELNDIGFDLKKDTVYRIMKKYNL